jgi:diguanylate cyclase (GGDEF)-like protein
MTNASRSTEEQLRRLRSRLDRERAARKEAERIAETVTRGLYQKQSELKLLEAVATAANEASSIEEAMEVALRRICAHTGWPVGQVFLATEDSPHELVPASVCHFQHAERFRAFRRATEAIRLGAGEGLPGRVLASGKPTWIIDVTTDPNFPRGKAAAEVGLKAAFAFPVLAGSEVVAVLEFFAPEAAAPDQGLLELMAHVGTQIGRVVERARAQERLAEQAFHDPLTGVRNRRSLLADLEQGLSRATEERPLLLALFDLDGFKAYNDTFGHPAGDALLCRLARSLETSVQGRGCAYRMGGDEFCILASLEGTSPESITSEATASLSERGEAFCVTASHGCVSLPTEATTPSEALRTADRRMYARKSFDSRVSPGRQSTDVLLRVLSERNPALGIHLDEVTELCRAVAAKLDLPDDEMAPLLQAASLHDVGKAAIPDNILKKPGPLGEEELEFMRRHPLIGERILNAAPALADAAKLVRSSHERFDGKGYPDGLRGTEIPLGARIIAVCDAYDSMTSNRPYRSAMSIEGMVSELRRCAGTQFDPAVVDAFCAVLAERKQLQARVDESAHGNSGARVRYLAR